MPGITKVNVAETAVTLKELIKKCNCPHEVLKLRILYSLKIGKPITEIVLVFGLGRTTVHRWLKIYKKSGLETYLELETVNGRKTIIPEFVVPYLRQAIILGEIESYQQANNWLIDKYEIPTNYNVTRNFLLNRFQNDPPICSTFIKKKSAKVS